MTRNTLSSAAVATALLGLSLSTHANTLRPSPGEVQDQIRIMETSVNASSVSSRFSDTQREAKLELLERARTLAAQGNQTTALDLVEQAGRLLYPMERRDQVSLTDAKRRQWLNDIDRVMVEVLPAAFAIAEEKGVVSDDLITAASLREHGVAKRDAGDLDAADNLLVDAYNRMQAAVAELRSGDQLTVELERDDPRLAWAEAERRYQDWQVTASWMATIAPTLEADAEALASSRDEADAIYRQAVALAESGQWQAAVETIDRAYLVMEDRWREAGIDI
jgi:tetratricopeptide (TPR) repeat protein